MSDIKKILSPTDRAILNADASVNWVPKDPKDIIAPYIESSTEDMSDVEVRLTKAKEVYDGYGKVIEECKELEDEISAQCKDVKITIDPRRALGVANAVQRVFGTDGTEITFEMYKLCIDELAKLNNKNIPSPGDKQS